MSDAAPRYPNHRFPPEIIARAVWLYYRSPLSLRHVEEMLLERGDYGFLRDDPPVGPEARARLCTSHSPQAAFVK